jgi:protein-arginine kinase activator protein McsA
MKGLRFIGSMLVSSFVKKIPFEKQKEIRKTLSSERICDLCLADYKHQTKDGQRLCSKCFIEYGNELNK